MDGICSVGSLVSVPGSARGSPRLYLSFPSRGPLRDGNNQLHHVQTMWRRGQELLVVVSLPQRRLVDLSNHSYCSHPPLLGYSSGRAKRGEVLRGTGKASVCSW